MSSENWGDLNPELPGESPEHTTTTSNGTVVKILNIESKFNFFLQKKSGPSRETISIEHMNLLYTLVP